MIDYLIYRLAKLCTALRTGQSAHNRSAEDDLELMRGLVQKYGDFPHSSVREDARMKSGENSRNGGKTIVSVPRDVYSHIPELTCRSLR